MAVALFPERTLPARNASTQQIMFIRSTVNFNDGGIATGVLQIGTLPQGAFITAAHAEVVTAFNAVTTNVLTIGTVSGTATNIFGAADITEATPAVYPAPATSLGRATAAAGDVAVYAKFTQTGTAATAGQAVIVIQYAPPNDG